MHHKSSHWLLTGFIALWFVFSLGYIGYDVWSDFKTGQLQQARDLGKAETIENLITQAQTCQTVPVFSGENRVDLISVQCLQQQIQNAGGSAPSTEVQETPAAEPEE